MMTFLLPILAQVASQTDQVEGLSFGWLFVKTILAMMLVIGLAIFLIRYLLPRIQGVGNPRAGNIKILERFGLEPRKVLYIVEVEKQKILIGTTDHQITKLMDLSQKEN